MPKVVSLVLGGGRGTRLYPLTKYRSKPAVPLAGKYRLIDIPLSNCINSGMNRIYVLTQFLSVSLHRHIRQAYKFDRFSEGFVEILAAQQTMAEGTDWYQGTADAVRKNIRYLEQPGIDYVIILSGDQLYRMDYREMLKTHIDSGAKATIAGLPVSRKEAHSLGVMRVDDTGKVEGFLEKPKTDPEIDSVAMSPEWFAKQGVEAGDRECLASMGIYIFDRDFLLSKLRENDDEDFGNQIFPKAIDSSHVQVHLFDGYWEDIGTIRAFFEANLSVASDNPPFDYVSPEAPVFTRARHLPSSRIGGATVTNSLLSDGCTIGKGTTIENSVIGLRCVIGENVTIRNSVIMGADIYETQKEIDEEHQQGQPVLGIGSGSTIEGAIVDKNCHIGENVKIVFNGQQDADDIDGLCSIRDGIPVVHKDAILNDGWTLS